MSELQTSVPLLLELPDIRATTKRRAPAALQTCMVVSVSPLRAQMLVRAAHEEHWSTIVCNSAEDALRQAARQRVQLALIDLQSAPADRVSSLKKMVEQLAARRMLLALCGKSDDVTGEVWSRQLGVWMYLPGVDSQSDIALLCAEAKHVLEKLGGCAAHTGT
jgi:ActR/RegA family two-component response regulator